MGETVANQGITIWWGCGMASPDREPLLMKSRLRIEGSGVRLSGARIASVERRFRISLPKDYRDFLLKHNGGRPVPSGFHFKYERGPYTDGEVASFLRIGNYKHDSFERDFRFFKIEHRWLPDNLVPIGSDPYGNSICISVSGDNRGAIYFRDVEGLPAAPGADIRKWKNIHLLADSFKEFISALSDQTLQTLDRRGDSRR